MALAIQSRTDPLAARAFAALDDAGVIWCLLRGAYAQPAEGSGDDVDLLVDGRSVELADAALRALGFARVPSWGRGAHRFYLAYTDERDRWLKIDIDTEISYGRFEHLPSSAAAGCLARRVRHEDGWALAPDDAFWTLVLHCLLDKHEFRAAHRQVLTALAPSAGDSGDLATIVACAYPNQWSPARIIGATVNGEWEALKALAPALERRWMEQAGAAARRTALRNGSLQRATKLLNASRRRGITVALLGPDGSGKSSVAEEVRRDFPFPVRSIYMGLYQGQARGVPVPGLGLGLRLARLWRNCLRAAYHQTRGRVVLYDRFTYDHRVAADGPQPFKRRARRWLLAHACPAPDLTLVLDAPGTLLYARKGEHSAEYLEEQRRRFRALADSTPGVEIVDATRDLDAVRRDIVARIWRRYAARWR